MIIICAIILVWEKYGFKIVLIFNIIIVLLQQQL